MLVWEAIGHDGSVCWVGFCPVIRITYGPVFAIKDHSMSVNTAFTDPFLKVTGVTSEPLAMSSAIQAALQRNKTYKETANGAERAAFRAELAKQLRIEAQRYSVSISDPDHCSAIRRISDAISAKCGNALVNNRFRYCTAQKAFNLYLKFLWKLGLILQPPHCPVDSIVLAAADIEGAWTKCDSEEQYLAWINELRRKAMPLTLADWESQVWLRDATEFGDRNPEKNGTA